MLLEESRPLAVYEVTRKQKGKRLAKGIKPF
jgi:hypothetical protein